MSGTRRPVSANARTAVTSFVHIDLPIFIGSDVACGYFGCDIEVERLPQKDETFPWPKPWLIAFRELFEGQSTQVWGEAAWEWPPSEIHFTLYGLVCADWDEARALVQHIERVSGSLFNGHDRWWSAEFGISEREQVPRLDKPIEGSDAAIFEVSVNGQAVGIESVEHLGCWLHELDVQKEFELWITVKGGPSLCMLRNGADAFLMYVREAGDSGFTSVGNGDVPGVVQYRLSNGQIDEHPRSWSIDVEQGYKAVAYFYVNDGARPAWIHWSPN
jgi:hypothetical protein